MLQMVKKSSSEKLRDMLDIKIKLSSAEARELAKKGELPANVEVEGSLHLSHTKITSLPGGLCVNGYLDLENSKITSLPDGLHVNGNLFLRDTKITSLPEDIVVGRDVWVSKKLKGKKPKGVKGEVVVD